MEWTTFKRGREVFGSSLDGKLRGVHYGTEKQKHEEGDNNCAPNFCPYQQIECRDLKECQGSSKANPQSWKPGHGAFSDPEGTRKPTSKVSWKH
ncbi:hypothetical protein HPP92_022315 [Vanilla planifolia]|uniref:Uncharacterized protein n=1 Tax=Vanilla planifolia TaxID=51239 RepID=A0A835PTU1_VANPL|nr:hypothetical protein HPP92_022315 [Vanilla planifolia]